MSQYNITLHGDIFLATRLKCYSRNHPSIPYRYGLRSGGSGGGGDSSRGLANGGGGGGGAKGGTTSTALSVGEAAAKSNQARVQVGKRESRNV